MRPRAQTSKASTPHPYVFTHTIGMDCFEVTDSRDERYTLLSVTCLGTCFQQTYVVRKRRWYAVRSGVPYGFVTVDVLGRVAEAYRADRGLHSRGVLSAEFARHGVIISEVGIDSPEHSGRVERHGGL